jgi:hypothetical protein
MGLLDQLAQETKQSGKPSAGGSNVVTQAKQYYAQNKTMVNSIAYAGLLMAVLKGSAIYMQ